jgi:hypothetical protein
MFSAWYIVVVIYISSMKVATLDIPMPGKESCVHAAEYNRWYLIDKTKDIKLKPHIVCEERF